jgi:hypothetical protein
MVLRIFSDALPYVNIFWYDICQKSFVPLKIGKFMVFLFLNYKRSLRISYFVLPLSHFCPPCPPLPCTWIILGSEHIEWSMCSGTQAQKTRKRQLLCDLQPLSCHLRSPESKGLSQMRPLPSDVPRASVTAMHLVRQCLWRNSSHAIHI